MKRVIFFILSSALSGTASAYCFAEASKEYNIPETLLRAIAKVESGGRQDAIRLPGVAGNVDRSTDYGLMQINSVWLPKLSRYHIDKKVLLEDACINVKVGAWILAGNIDRLGYGWEAVGAYNAGCKGISKQRCAQLRNTYTNKVYKALKKIAPNDSDVSGPRHIVKNETNFAPHKYEVAMMESVPGISTISFGKGMN
jgi:soluble lytic murein transglycosylase-like protein